MKLLSCSGQGSARADFKFDVPSACSPTRAQTQRKTSASANLQRPHVLSHALHKSSTPRKLTEKKNLRESKTHADVHTNNNGPRLGSSMVSMASGPFGTDCIAPQAHRYSAPCHDLRQSSPKTEKYTLTKEYLPPRCLASQSSTTRIGKLRPSAAWKSADAFVHRVGVQCARFVGKSGPRETFWMLCGAHGNFLCWFPEPRPQVEQSGPQTSAS